MEANVGREDNMDNYLLSCSDGGHDFYSVLFCLIFWSTYIYIFWIKIKSIISQPINYKIKNLHVLLYLINSQRFEPETYPREEKGGFSIEYLMLQ